MLQTVVSNEAAQRLREGQAQLSRDDILSVEGSPEPGQPATLLAEDGRVLGVGDVDLDAPVAVRRLGLPEEPLEGVIPRQLRRALKRRAGLVDSPRFCRIVNDEGDGLPGLVVDRYDNHYALQTLSKAMDARLDELTRVLVEVAGAQSVLLRNDTFRRPLEGLARARHHVLYGTPPRWARIQELGARLTVDLYAGTETGHRYELREARRAVAHLAHARRVLELSCQVGSKVVQAGLAGARHILAYDAHPDAVELTHENVAMHGLMGRAHVERGSPKEALDRVHTTFDLVLLDIPPDSVDELGRALVHGAMRTVRRGGTLLVSASRSLRKQHRLDAWLQSAAAQTGRAGFELYRPATPADFPTLLGTPESFAVRVLELD